jgi:hypothetical protein
MIKKTIICLLVLSWMIIFSGFSRAQSTPLEQRIRQDVIVNGQQVPGVTVIQNGTVQNFTCPSPEPYTTVDQSSSGWSCFDATSGTWLLHAMPPQQSGSVYEQPPVYYPEGAYGYYPDVYPYYSYPYYPYSFWGWPGFGFGFGFGHGNERFEHGHGFEHGGQFHGGQFHGGQFHGGQFHGGQFHGGSSFGGHPGGFGGHPGGGFAGHGGGSFGHGGGSFGGGGGGHGGGGHR